MYIEIPPHVATIIHTLNQAGHEAYAVGGCVRDALLGRVAADWDITTSASPYEVKDLFRRTVDTGLQHGTVTVMMDKTGYEVTTYRVDGEYEDGRHPKQVAFTKSLKEDLQRRDFTINAMAYHPEEGIVDLFCGIEDLKNRIIRAVGVPEERFQEDALRIMRAVRFSAQLDFDIEEGTLNAIRKFTERLNLISRERIQVEMNKLLKSDHPEKFLTLYDTGITKVLFPEFDIMMDTPQNTPWHSYNVGIHTIETMKQVPADHILRWTALLHDVGKIITRSTDENGKDHFYGHAKVSAEYAHKFLRGLKFDTHTIDMVTLLVRHHDAYLDGTSYNVRKVMNRVGAENFPALLQIHHADTMAKSPYAQEKLFPIQEEVHERYQEVLAAKECTSLKTLAVSGRDLIGIGIAPGKILGETLNQLLMIVLEKPEMNTKEALLDIADDIMRDLNKETE